MKERIGFIGLGNMGEGMADQHRPQGLAADGRGASPPRRGRPPGRSRRHGGRKPARTGRGVATSSCCASPDRREVEAAINGPDGLASAGKPLMIIDCSTSDPAVTMPARRRTQAEGHHPDRRAARAARRRRPRKARSTSWSAASAEDFARARAGASKPSPGASSTPDRSAPATR